MRKWVYFTTIIGGEHLKTQKWSTGTSWLIICLLVPQRIFIYSVYLEQNIADWDVFKLPYVVVIIIINIIINIVIIIIIVFVVDVCDRIK